ncbi:chromatin assembly factor 1 subunit B-like isoform X2 [Varroa jacobsoni]|uniref:chromatin assembly factor 1 subunit B-like isoform X2 n=1 Tax=Varroa jacobsoni TaxID=62625 RepID=UPI000BF2DF4E|nr:chromatin assembly factor 1 subunit B-like isoform X2 [Varroa jacobsoni]
MRCVVPQLAWWLDTSPLFSVDFQPANEDGSLRMATCGTDTHVRVWWLKLEVERQPTESSPKNIEPSASTNSGLTVLDSPKKAKDRDKIDIELRADLTRHQRTVSVVRFSHTGEILASGDDEANIILWKLQSSFDGAPQLFDASENKENWQVYKVLRGHIEDVCDLQWSPRDSCLISGSIDSASILWDVSTGRSLGFFKERKGFIQGVAYDPRGRFVAALSSDRQMYVYSTDTRKKIWVAAKAEIPQNGDREVLSTRLFHDDTLKSFCRRPDFSPDGEFLVAPSGVIENNGQITNCIYVFHRSNFSKPVALIPTDKQVTTVVRFSNKFYKTRHSSGSAVVLPYRMVFAAATINMVLVCDTETFTPFAMISDAHYARISDLTWSPDNHTLMASSTDGYCSFMFFEGQELGEQYQGDLPHIHVVEDVLTRRKRTKAPKKKDDSGGERKEASDGDPDQEEMMDVDDDMDDDVDNINLDDTQHSGDGNDSEGKATPNGSPAKEKENKDVSMTLTTAITGIKKKELAKESPSQQKKSATLNTPQQVVAVDVKDEKRVTLTTLDPPPKGK